MLHRIDIITLAAANIAGSKEIIMGVRTEHAHPHLDHRHPPRQPGPILTTNAAPKGIPEGQPSFAPSEGSLWPLLPVLRYLSVLRAEPAWHSIGLWPT